MERPMVITATSTIKRNSSNNCQKRLRDRKRNQKRESREAWRVERDRRNTGISVLPGKPVPDTIHRLNIPRLLWLGLNFPAQIHEMHIDRALDSFIVLTKNPSHELIPRKNA